MKILGIDIGTTSISLAVLEKESQALVRTVTIRNDSFLQTSENWKKLQKVEIIERKVTDEIQKLFWEFEDIVSVGLTGQMHGIVYVDAVGNSVSPLYTWQDGRGNQPVSGGSSPVECIREKTGENVYSGYGWVTHFYNQEMNEVPETAVSFCTIADYIGMRLTGRKYPILHASMASSLGFFDIEKNEFKTEILQTLGINSDMAPEVTDRVKILGKFHNIPVYTAIGDNQASVLGAAGKEPAVILVNMGTGGQISVVTDRNIRIPGIETRPFLRGRYLLVGASLCGGRAYSILEKFFRQYIRAAGLDDCEQYDIMEKILDENPVFSSLKIKTTFQGTRMNPDIRGSIEGIGEDNFTPAALIEGVIYGMVRELYDMYAEISTATEVNTEILVASGNGVRKNRYLRKAFETVFEKKLVLSPYKEEAACGAAICNE